MSKSPDAFRTISEVAELLETPAHVLRFWESRFPQIRPVKRAGGRRYYRPADVALLSGIKRLLHDEGMTIRGVQKILREQGVRHVSGVAEEAAGDAADDAALEAALSASLGPAEPETPLPPAEAETAQVIALQTALRDAPRPADTAAPATTAPEVVAFPAPDPAPVSPAPPPARPRAPEPVMPDLFSRLEPEAAPVSPPAPPPAPPSAPPPAATEEPVADAPMLVWAEESDTAEPEPAPAPAPSAFKITRIGPATAPAEPVREEVPAPAGPTLASRLRATDPKSVPAGARRDLAALQARAVQLRARLTAGARMPF